VRVSEVQPGSSAENAGLRVGDILLSLDGIALNATTPAEVSAMFTRAGTVLAVEVIAGAGLSDAPIDGGAGGSRGPTPTGAPAIAAAAAAVRPSSVASGQGSAVGKAATRMPIRASVLGTTVQAPDLWTFFLGWRRWRNMTRHRLVASYQADGNESPVGGGNASGDDDGQDVRVSTTAQLRSLTARGAADNHNVGTNRASASAAAAATAAPAKRRPSSLKIATQGGDGIAMPRVRSESSEGAQQPTPASAASTAAFDFEHRPDSVDSVARLNMEFVENPSPSPTPDLVVAPAPPPLTAEEAAFQKTERALYALSETLLASRAHMEHIEADDECETALDRFHMDNDLAAIYQESGESRSFILKPFCLCEIILCA